MNFIKGSKTFGESHNLKKLIDREMNDAFLKQVKDSNKEVIVTVSNLTHNRVEYKSLKDCSFVDFRDWIWASTNYVPFMSLMVKNHYEYADGGFANLVPIEEAIKMGATEIDAIILETEVSQINRMPSKNPFSLLTNIFEFMQDNLEKQNVSLGKLAAKHHNVALDLYYTPAVLTTNSLVFDKKKMRQWWDYGYRHAQKKNGNN
jgi:predicted patatin/cPLA2 family phospholipase